MRDHYETLGVGPAATTEEIRAAYRKLAFQHHPDRNPEDADAEKRFKELAEAYSVLSDAKQKALYDRVRQAPRRDVPPPPGPQPAQADPGLAAAFQQRYRARSRFGRGARFGVVPPTDGQTVPQQPHGFGDPPMVDGMPAFFMFRKKGKGRD
jgi:curved DNA-binding protein CbpA